MNLVKFTNHNSKMIGSYIWLKPINKTLIILFNKEDIQVKKVLFKL